MKFDITLEHQVDMAKRYNHSFCIILFDIDNFKSVNDTYGHQVGDNILVEMAQRIKNSMRKSDTFARWGGEEFAIILPQSRVKTAVKIANNLRLKIANNAFEDGLSITCSFGVCEYKKSYELEDLIECVDKKLYFAKSEGKNQVQS
jgi:diguanylate cyclase (GGDEF)-like protein